MILFGNKMNYLMLMCLLLSLSLHLMIFVGEKPEVPVKIFAEDQIVMSVVDRNRNDFFLGSQNQVKTPLTINESLAGKVQPSEQKKIASNPISENKIAVQPTFNTKKTQVVNLRHKSEVTATVDKLSTVAEVKTETSDIQSEEISDGRYLKETLESETKEPPLVINGESISTSNSFNDLSAPAEAKERVDSGSARQVIPPRYRDCPAPEYPSRARVRGWSGKVDLAIKVLADGQVGKITLTKSSGYPILDRAGIKAVRNWIFHPAIKDGVEIDYTATVPLEFTLK
jgi:TonB family protein